ncbi:band 4.1-like protein 4A [Watersipora subatra]|uniref:band 4.1-like protein 4A n=1 Tax=Watersipora subatra TaxID=2589382 RepID=UPI00355C48CB
MVTLSCFSQEGTGKKGTISCQVALLDDTSYNIRVKKHSKGQVLLDEVCKYLNISETDYFGLRLLGQTKISHWLDLQKALMREIKRYGLHTNPVKLYFGVKFYATDPCKLKEEITRYQFFLQLKRDVLNGRITLAFDHLVELCSLVIQSELGDYSPEAHTLGYVSELRLVPHQSEELEQAIALNHQKLM